MSEERSNGHRYELVLAEVVRSLVGRSAGFTKRIWLCQWRGESRGSLTAYAEEVIYVRSIVGCVAPLQSEPSVDAAACQGPG